jgi:hypothetical protein
MKKYGPKRFWIKKRMQERHKNLHPCAQSYKEMSWSSIKTCNMGEMRTCFISSLSADVIDFGLFDRIFMLKCGMGVLVRLGFGRTPLLFYYKKSFKKYIKF